LGCDSTVGTGIERAVGQKKVSGIASFSLAMENESGECHVVFVSMCFAWCPVKHFFVCGGCFVFAIGICRCSRSRKMDKPIDCIGGRWYHTIRTEWGVEGGYLWRLLLNDWKEIDRSYCNGWKRLRLMDFTRPGEPLTARLRWGGFSQAKYYVGLVVDGGLLG